MPNVPYPYEVNGKLVTGNGSLTPIFSLSNSSLLPSLTVFTFFNVFFLLIFSLHVTTSIYPVPSICSQDQISDWFASLAECLHWNVRKKQKAIDELSDLTRSSSGMFNFKS